MNRYPINWAELRVFVLERDNYTCQHCGAKENEIRTSTSGKAYKATLQIAHLDHNPEDNVHTDRLLSLCQPCHLKNDREHVQELQRLLLARERVSKDTRKGLTKPQMKSIIKGLHASVNELEKQLSLRDKQIGELMCLLSNQKDLIDNLNPNTVVIKEILERVKVVNKEVIVEKETGATQQHRYGTKPGFSLYEYLKKK